MDRASILRFFHLLTSEATGTGTFDDTENNVPPINPRMVPTILRNVFLAPRTPRTYHNNRYDPLETRLGHRRADFGILTPVPTYPCPSNDFHWNTGATAGENSGLRAELDPNIGDVPEPTFPVAGGFRPAEDSDSDFEFNDDDIISY
jgi:hypothetical protein